MKHKDEPGRASSVLLLCVGCLLIACAGTPAPQPRNGVAPNAACVVTPERRAQWREKYVEAGWDPEDAGPDISYVEYNDFINTLPTHGNTLFDVLEKRGITAEHVARLRLSLGDSPGVVEISDPEEIDEWWWEYFRVAEPYKYWVPTRPDIVEIFLKGKPEAEAVLRVNETDSTGINGHQVTYMCRGLSERIHREVAKDRGEEGPKPTDNVQENAGSTADEDPPN